MWPTQCCACRDSRSENVAKSNANGALFVILVKKCSIYIGKHNVLRTRFWLPTFLSFLVWKLDISQVGNRVQKTLQNPMKSYHFLVILPKKCSIYIGKHNVFVTRFSLPIFLTFPMGKLDFLKVGNRVQKPLCFAMDLQLFWAKSQKKHSIRVRQ